MISFMTHWTRIIQRTVFSLRSLMISWPFTFLSNFSLSALYMQSLGFICSSLYQSTYNIPRLMPFLLLLHSVIISSGDVVMYKPSMRWAIEWRGWVVGILGSCWELLLVLYVEPHAIGWLMKVFMQLINTQYACQQFLVVSSLGLRVVSRVLCIFICHPSTATVGLVSLQERRGLTSS